MKRMRKDYYQFQAWFRIIYQTLDCETERAV